MVKNVIPQKARKSAAAAGAGSGSAPSSHKKSGSAGGGGGRKHGGLGAHNAFENLTYRSKHEVLSLAKPKGKLKRPAAAHSAQLAARQQSLLAELGTREKANSFVDERLEESNTSIDVEDKLLLRFQKERQKRLAASSKAARFGLHDDGDTMQLTHGGQALSLAPAVRRPEGEEGEDDEDEDAQDARLAAASRVDGEEGAEGEEDGNESGHKSRHDVMSEVMLKSKMFRAERAVLAGEQQDLMGNLDSEFDLVRAGMDWASKEDRMAAKRGARASETNTGEINAAKKAAKKAGAGAGAGADGGEGETERDVDGDVVFVDGQLDPTDEFVLEAKQLGLQVRAKASDRLKSDEEVIAQEKRRLEKLERQRLKRMRGESDAHEDEEDDGEDPDTPAAKRRRQRKEVKESLKKAAAAAASNRRATDDDLEQNFKLTSKAVGGRPADQVADHELISDDEDGGDDDDEDEDDSDEDEDEEDEEEEDENDEAMDDLPEEDDKPLKAVFIGSTPAASSAAASSSKQSGSTSAAKSAQKEIFIGNDGKSSVSAALLAITAKLAGGAGAKPAASVAASGATSSSAASTIPFTFAAPTSYNDFKATLSAYPSDQHSLIIHRIRTCNHISLAPENRAKMEKFYAILLTHFRRTAQEFQKRPDATKDSAAVANLVAKLDMIGKHLSELNEIPSMNAAVGRAFRAQLVKMRASLDAEDGSVASFEPDQILLMKLAATLFPTSDFRHNVVTPLLLLQAEWLNRLVVSSASEVIKGFLVVSLMLHEINESKRVVPEILTFLHSALLHGTGIAKAEGERAPTTPAAAPAAPASKKQKASTVAASSTELDTGAPPTGSAGETFSVQPSALRLHNSLQSRNCNFLPSKELAFWASMLTPTAAAAAPAAKKSKKTEAAAQQQQDLHIPLEWIFMSSDAALAAASPAVSAGAATQLQLSTFSTLLQLIHQSAQLWQATAPSYGELFVPLLDSLGHILSQQRAGVFAALPPTLQTYTTHLHTYLSSSIAHSISLRRPLEASLAPFTLKQHTPIFTEGYNPTKDYDPIKERAHIKELGAKLKREKKGAMRELRRDTAVVVSQQRAVANAYAAERETKRKEVWSQMEEQQRDTNIMHRESKKKQDKKDKSKSRKK